MSTAVSQVCANANIYEQLDNFFSKYLMQIAQQHTDEITVDKIFLCELQKTHQIDCVFCDLQSKTAKRSCHVYNTHVKLVEFSEERFVHADVVPRPLVTRV